MKKKHTQLNEPGEIYKVWRVGTVQPVYRTYAATPEEALSLVIKTNKLDGSKKYNVASDVWSDDDYFIPVRKKK